MNWKNNLQIHKTGAVLIHKNSVYITQVPRKTSPAY